MRHHEGFNITGCKIKLFVQSETKTTVPGVKNNLHEKNYPNRANAITHEHKIYDQDDERTEKLQQCHLVLHWHNSWIIRRTR
jgi:hypothetical protein